MCRQENRPFFPVKRLSNIPFIDIRIAKGRFFQFQKTYPVDQSYAERVIMAKKREETIPRKVKPIPELTNSLRTGPDKQGIITDNHRHENVGRERSQQPY
jgi:hypothetical protein